jgi:hypothetical protein
MAILVNDNLEVRANKPTDARYGPHASTGAANSAIPSAYRHIGLTVLVGTDEYWYKDGIQNGDLVLKTVANTIGSVSGLTAALANKMETSERGSTNGVAPLVNGVIPSQHLPQLDLSSFLGSVANEAAMLGLSTATAGDWCYRDDLQAAWILVATPYSSLSSWRQMSSSQNLVTSVANKTGDIDLEIGDIADLQDYVDATTAELQDLQTTTATLTDDLDATNTGVATLTNGLANKQDHFTKRELTWEHGYVSGLQSYPGSNHYVIDLRGPLTFASVVTQGIKITATSSSMQTTLIRADVFFGSGAPYAYTYTTSLVHIGFLQNGLTRQQFVDFVNNLRSSTSDVIRAEIVDGNDPSVLLQPFELALSDGQSGVTSIRLPATAQQNDRCRITALYAMPNLVLRLMEPNTDAFLVWTPTSSLTLRYEFIHTGQEWVLTELFNRATTADAQDATRDDVVMTPARTKEAIDKFAVLTNHAQSHSLSGSDSIQPHMIGAQLALEYIDIDETEYLDKSILAQTNKHYIINKITSDTFTITLPPVFTNRADRVVVRMHAATNEPGEVIVRRIIGSNPVVYEAIGTLKAHNDVLYAVYNYGWLRDFSTDWESLPGKPAVALAGHTHDLTGVKKPLTSGTVEVRGAPLGEANGTYTRIQDLNGRARYQKGVFSIYWDPNGQAPGNGTWEFERSDIQSPRIYVSMADNNENSPTLITSWTDASGIPAPMLRVLESVPLNYLLDEKQKDYVKVLASTTLTAEIGGRYLLNTDGAVTIIDPSGGTFGDIYEVLALHNDVTIGNVLMPKSTVPYYRRNIGAPGAWQTVVNNGVVVYASQSEATAGTASNKTMSPLRTAEAITAQARQVARLGYGDYPATPTSVLAQRATIQLGRTALPGARVGVYEITGFVAGSTNDAFNVIELPSNPATSQVGDVVVIRTRTALPKEVRILEYSYLTNSSNTRATLQAKNSEAHFVATAESPTKMTWQRVYNENHHLVNAANIASLNVAALEDGQSVARVAEEIVVSPTAEEGEDETLNIEDVVSHYPCVLRVVRGVNDINKYTIVLSDISRHNADSSVTVISDPLNNDAGEGTIQTIEIVDGANQQIIYTLGPTQPENFVDIGTVTFEYRYALGDSGSASWVRVNQEITNAPHDNKAYVRKNSSWVDLDSLTGQLNLIANPPSTPTSTGTKGQLAVSGQHLYVCIGTNTWLRTIISNW